MQAGSDTPRVLKGMLPQYRGRLVRIVGKVINSTGTVTVLESGGDQIPVHIADSSSLNAGDVIEVIGMVRDDDTVSAEKTTPFGADFDMATYDAFVKVTHEHPTLF